MCPGDLDVEFFAGWHSFETDDPVGDLETVLADALHFRSPVGVPAFGAGLHPFTPRPRGARESAVSCLSRRGCQLSFIVLPSPSTEKPHVTLCQRDHTQRTP